MAVGLWKLLLPGKFPLLDEVRTHLDCRCPSTTTRCLLLRPPPPTRPPPRATCAQVLETAALVPQALSYSVHCKHDGAPLGAARCAPVTLTLFAAAYNPTVPHPLISHPVGAALTRRVSLCHACCARLPMPRRCNSGVITWWRRGNRDLCRKMFGTCCWTLQRRSSLICQTTTRAFL